MNEINDKNGLKENFLYEIELDKKYKVRKWKAKEKKEFLKTIKEKENLDDLQDILVYNCIEGKAAFSIDEFKYVFSKMRQISLGEKIKLEFFCNECKSKFIQEIPLDDIIKPIFSKIKNIQSKNYNIELSGIVNPDFYKKIISENVEYSKEYDFYLRIKSINDNETMTLEEIVEMFDNMDIDEYDYIFNEWEKIRFKINDIVDISCNNCNHIVKYSFDEVPGFFPNSWFK